MIHMHDKELKKISEFNLLHDIINPPKRAKNLKSSYSPILHGFMNTRHGRSKFNNFQILLDSGCSTTIIIGRLVEKLSLEKYALMQWHMQAVNITTNYKVKVYFTLPALSATNVVMWRCHMHDSDMGRYYMILLQDLLTELGLNLKFSEHVIEAYDGPFK